MNTQLRHIVTWECQRGCLACPNQHLGVDMEEAPVPMDVYALMEVYDLLARRGHTQITITGGEPMLHSDTEEVVRGARATFPYVTLLSSDPTALSTVWPLAAIVYGIYEEEDIRRVDTTTPVFASVLVENYDVTWLEKLFKAGFSGLSLRESYPDGEPFDKLLPTFANFSVRYTPLEDCLPATYILPTLRILEVP